MSAEELIGRDVMDEPLTESQKEREATTKAKRHFLSTSALFSSSDGRLEMG